MRAAADTIFARASGAGRAGVAVFRLSGPAAFSLTAALVGPLPPARQAALRDVRTPDGDLIDRGLVLVFKAPASYTGEDVAELHLHGGKAVEAALYAALSLLGARPAEAGEFTRRALVNGKLDLAEIEGLADLLDAETALQRKQALGQLGGRLSGRAEAWRERLIAILAPLEADIDFPDEEGVPAAIAARAGPEIEALVEALEASLATAARAQSLRDGVKVALLGAPNAGKSSLLNRLAGSERAIVAASPGTTRDVVEVRLDLGGAPVVLADTAGLRSQTTDDVEAEGIRRTRMTAEEADLRVFVADRGAGEIDPAILALVRPGDFLVWSKKDLGAIPGTPPQAFDSPGHIFPVSAKTGEGVEAFLGRLTESARSRVDAGDGALTRARHVRLVRSALSELKAAREMIGEPELAAEHVRLAIRSLGGITGAVGVEDVLDAIFASFCIGK